jgi:hypothetical protein
VARLGRMLFNLTTAAAVAGLAYGNWIIVTQPIDTSPVRPHGGESVTASQVRVTTDAKLVTISDLAETLTRPLFSATRRPFQRTDPVEAPVAPVVAAAPVQAAPAETRLNLRVLGMMRGGGTQRALLQRDGEDGASWVAVGAEFAGWRLTSLDGDGASVESGGSKAVLKLHPALVAQRTAN